MRWEDLSIDGVWTIRTEDREKGNAGELKLPKMAADLIAAQPRMGDNPHVFARRGGCYLTGYCKAKMAFDRKVAGKLPSKRLHERGTAPTLVNHYRSIHVRSVMNSLPNTIAYCLRLSPCLPCGSGACMTCAGPPGRF